MDLQRWQLVERVLDRALTSDPSSWSSLLDDTCSGDPDLRAEVEALLAKHSAAEQFLATPPAAAAAALIAEALEQMRNRRACHSERSEPKANAVEESPALVIPSERQRVEESPSSR